MRAHAGSGGAQPASAEVMVRRQLMWPVSAWTLAPVAVLVACAVGGHRLGGLAGVMVAAVASGGAVVSLRRGARLIGVMLGREHDERDAVAAAEAERRGQAMAFWQRASSSLGVAVEVLREGHAELAAGRREITERAATHDRDFLNLTSAWMGHYQREVDGILDGVAEVLGEVRRGRIPARPAFPDLPGRPPGGPFDELDRRLALVGYHVRDAVVQAAAADVGGTAAELKAFAGLGRRLRGRLDRVLTELDGLENRTADPDLLHGLLRVDHLLVLMRRDGDAVQVLAGDPLRQGGQAADAVTVLRQATAEIEEYARVRVGSAAEVAVAPYARSSVIHMVAALAENATRFSTGPVVLDSAVDASGLVITVTDTGLGMGVEDFAAHNALLADPDPAAVRARLIEGRIGLVSTAMLARRYGMRVSLHPAGERGVRGRIVVPAKLLVLPTKPTSPAPPPGAARPGAGTTRPAPSAASSPIPAASAPTAAAELASVSRLPFPRRSGETPRPAEGRHAAPQQEKVRHDRDDRPQLPRRRRAAPAPGAPPAQENPVEPASRPAPGVIGAFVQGAARAGDLAASAADGPDRAER